MLFNYSVNMLLTLWGECDSELGLFINLFSFSILIRLIKYSFSIFILILIRVIVLFIDFLIVRFLNNRFVILFQFK